MNPLLVIEWPWQPDITAGLALLAAMYTLALVRFRPRTIWDEHIVTRREIGAFVLAMILLSAVLVSPLNRLSDSSVSIHMLQHVLMLFVIPPLILTGVPGWVMHPMVRAPMVRKTLHFLTNPIAAIVIFNGALLLWSVPTLWNDALIDPRVHAIEHLSFFAAGMIAWWPVFSPVEEVSRMSYPVQVFYLFLQSLIPSLIGIVLLFSSVVIYPWYGEAANPLGMSPLFDQRIAGLLLKLFGSVFLLIMVIVRFIQWIHHEEHEDEMIADDGHTHRLHTSVRVYPKGHSPRRD